MALAAAAATAVAALSGLRNRAWGCVLLLLAGMKLLLLLSNSICCSQHLSQRTCCSYYITACPGCSCRALVQPCVSISRAQVSDATLLDYASLRCLSRRGIGECNLVCCLMQALAPELTLQHRAKQLNKQSGSTGTPWHTQFLAHLGDTELLMVCARLRVGDGCRSARTSRHSAAGILMIAKGI